MAQIEVILRDFDGSKTIFPAELPLREVIHFAQTDLGVTVNKSYVRTTEKDDSGRIIYAERR